METAGTHLSTLSSSGVSDLVQLVRDALNGGIWSLKCLCFGVTQIGGDLKMHRCINIEEYRSILAFIFAIDEINKDPDLLPNVTLGYHVYDTCADPKKTLKYVLRILSGEKKEAPNYSCEEHGEVAGFIGDSGFHTSHAMAQLLALSNYPQINYGTTDPVLNDRELYPTFYRIVPDDRVRYAAIVKCLLHFGWNWVGIITPSDGSGDMELRELNHLTELRNRNFRGEEEVQGWSEGRRLGMRLRRRQEQRLGMRPENKGMEEVKNEAEEEKQEKAEEKAGEETEEETEQEINVEKGEEDQEEQVALEAEKVIILEEGQDCQEEEAVEECKYLELNAFEVSGTITPPSMRVMVTGYYGYTQNSPKISRGLESLTIPISRCNDRCPPGYRKASDGGFHICCYDCVMCSEGEMSNVTDSDFCHKCPDEEWPDERRMKCIPRTYDFLSYDKDVIVLISSVIALSCSIITLFILGIFIYYWNTPIVKANNRAISFILLVSILLSFLCVFLFLGRPVDITCMLRQTAFGIFFSTAVSSVLAKTVTVCIAFKATKPGSSWRKWVTYKVPNYVVIVCSSVQGLICGIWLSVSPPYQEYDHHTYQGMIIIQCNEGSVIGFYSVLGYMGILAAVSFVLAFMVRTLPDSFNEAKYITFSMLVFCSVWIAMIPAYLSTKGKYMVAVEIFAILTSCVGILGCIFSPKVYILLLKPELNSRKVMLEKNNL
ncbi:vomeronasal type-2 receptor 26-like [Mixophyes fleayi]|uniref:vomeronasal type-2 receptor 26-like n=1 Tax=Mixophyes fleayi TaxID=3061075 RepID=UPI003F4DD431